VCLLWNPQPVQVTEKVSDVVILPHVKDNILEPVQQVNRNTRQGRAAVVESHQYQ